MKRICILAILMIAAFSAVCFAEEDSMQSGDYSYALGDGRAIIS